MQGNINVDTTFFAENLTLEVKRVGVGIVSERSGISRQMLNRYMAGTAEPGLTALLKLSAALGISIDGLCGVISEYFTSDEFASIPYLDNSSIPENLQRRHQSYADKVLGNLLFSPTGCESEYLVNFSDLRLFYCDNQNMAPTVNNGDLCIVSVAPDHLDPSDGMFLISLNNSLMLRRLQTVSTQQVLAMSDSHNIESFSFAPGEDVTILGRVLMCMSKQ